MRRSAVARTCEAEWRSSSSGVIGRRLNDGRRADKAKSGFPQWLQRGTVLAVAHGPAGRGQLGANPVGGSKVLRPLCGQAPVCECGDLRGAKHGHVPGGQVGCLEAQGVQDALERRSIGLRGGPCAQAVDYGEERSESRGQVEVVAERGKEGMENPRRGGLGAAPCPKPVVSGKGGSRAAGRLRSSRSAVKTVSKIPDGAIGGLPSPAGFRPCENRFNAPSALPEECSESSVKLSCLRGWPPRRAYRTAIGEYPFSTRSPSV